MSETAFSAAIRPIVEGILTALGCAAQQGDVLLSFCVWKTEQEIQNACNVSEVPEGRYSAAAGVIICEYLTAGKAAGTLDMDHLDLESPLLKELDEGDTKQVFATDSLSSGEQKLDLFIASELGKRSQYLRYRRLVW